jgi:hypothetical protein
MKAGSRTKKAKRSSSLWLLILGGLLVSWFGWLRVQQTLVNFKLIGALGLQPRLPFLLASGVVYGLLGLSAALSLAFYWRWAYWYYPLAFFLVSLLYWIEHALLGVSPAGQVSLPFRMGFNLFLFAAVLVFLAQPKNLRAFHVDLVNPFRRKGQHAKQPGK